jgi:hypothetical protein
MRERRGVFVRKIDGTRPLGRPRRRWEDDIKMYLHEVGCGSIDGIELAQYRERCICGNEHSGSIKCGEFLD